MTENLATLRLKELGLDPKSLTSSSVKVIDKKRVEVSQRHDLLFIRGDQVAVVLEDKSKSIDVPSSSGSRAKRWSLLRFCYCFSTIKDTFSKRKWEFSLPFLSCRCNEMEFNTSFVQQLHHHLLPLQRILMVNCLTSFTRLRCCVAVLSPSTSTGGKLDKRREWGGRNQSRPRVLCELHRH